MSKTTNQKCPKKIEIDNGVASFFGEDGTTKILADTVIDESSLVASWNKGDRLYKAYGVHELDGSDSGMVLISTNGGNQRIDHADIVASLVGIALADTGSAEGVVFISTSFAQNHGLDHGMFDSDVDASTSLVGIDDVGSATDVTTATA